jgi:flagellar motor protein MotB
VVVAHGQYEPLVAKGDKAKNRRVEIIVHKH